MWCACKIGERHWEENFVRVNWDENSLVAFPNETNEDEQQLEENEDQGQVVCNLVGLRIALDEGGELEQECKNVTCGDYTRVLVLSPKSSDFVCVVGVEEVIGDKFLMWLTNCVSICNFKKGCLEAGVSFSGLKELMEKLEQHAMTDPGELEVMANAFPLATTENGRLFVELFNSYTRSLSIVDTVFDSNTGFVLFDGFRRFWRLQRLVIRGCSPLDEATVGFLCKGLLSISSRLLGLDLTDNGIEDGSALALAEAIPCLSSLEVLKLGDNEIESRGGRAIGIALRRLSNLREIHLNQNDIGDAGISAVASSLGSLAYLETVILHDCAASDGQCLRSMVKGLIANTNISVIGGLYCLDLQDNQFHSKAIRTFLSQCSGLGYPRVIKLGKKRRQGLVMAMEKENGSDKPTKQIVDLGFPSPTQHTKSMPESNEGENNKELALVEIIFGAEISPFRLLSTVINLLDLQPDQVRIHAGQPYRKDNMQLVQLVLPDRDYCNMLIQAFDEGYPTLHLLHVTSMQPVLDVDQDIVVSNEKSTPPPPVSVSVQSPTKKREEVSSMVQGDSNGGHRDPFELETDLLAQVRKLLIMEDSSMQSVDEMRVQLRNIAHLFSLLNIFVPSERSEIKRYAMEARLNKVDQNRNSGLSTRRSMITPLLAAAIARLSECGPSDALIVRAYAAAMVGDVDRCVSTAELGKYALGLMLSLNQVTHFESATLQAAVVSQDADLFSLIMSQDLNEDEVDARMIRLAKMIHNDLFARSSVLHAKPEQRQVHQHETKEMVVARDEADFAGLVVELLSFERLNSKWTPRELRLQFTNQPRPCPVTRPKIVEDPNGYWKSLSATRVEQAYVTGAARICELLQQAMGDARRSSDDPDGYGAAHEAFGIAFANREIGLEDELICQLVCQITCNPSLRSLDLGWRLIVLGLRILAPSRELCQTLNQIFDGRLNNELNPNHMVRWAQEALQHYFDSTPMERKIRKVFASDASVRLDVMRQIMCDDDSFEMDVYCANGTGTSVVISPFTSFEELLQQVHGKGSGTLYRHGHSLSNNEHENVEKRWRDFVFVYFDVQTEERHILSWEKDAYWWRWEIAMGQILSKGSEKSTDERFPALEEEPVRLSLETFVCAPTMWYLEPDADVLRTELIYWQRQVSLLRGDLCTSNPEALGFITCLSACIQISGGFEQWIDLSHEDQLRMATGHLPKAVRKRAGKDPSKPWVARFGAAVDAFAKHVSQVFMEDSTNNDEETFSTYYLQRAYIAYFDLWPLANGIIFRNISIEKLHMVSNPDPAPIRVERGEPQHARFVLNAKGLFLLVLAHDTYTSRAVALQWWTGLDEIVRIDIIDGSIIQIETRSMDVVSFAYANPKKFYKALVAQCTANLAVGHPQVKSQIRIADFAARFGDLPWPPPPPLLYDTKGNPIDLEQDIPVSMDLATATSCLMQNLQIE